MNVFLTEGFNRTGRVGTPGNTGRGRETGAYRTIDLARNNRDRKYNTKGNSNITRGLRSSEISNRYKSNKENRRNSRLRDLRDRIRHRGSWDTRGNLGPKTLKVNLNQNLRYNSRNGSQTNQRLKELNQNLRCSSHNGSQISRRLKDLSQNLRCSSHNGSQVSRRISQRVTDLRDRIRRHGSWDTRAANSLTEYLKGRMMHIESRRTRGFKTVLSIVSFG
jgi:hypothetical protein